MALVSPSLLSADFSMLKDELFAVEASGAHLLHLDVMDGVFVPNISFGAPVVSALRQHSGILFDTHLMVTHPLNFINQFAEAGSDLLTFHIESEDDPEAVLSAIEAAGMRAGISLCPETPVDSIIPFLSSLELVLVMSVHPGFGGQTFIRESLQKIKELKTEIGSQGLAVNVSVDGGINEKTAQAAKIAGADILVAGSAFFKAENKTEFVSLLEG